jgi:hypothetical protein
LSLTGLNIWRIEKKSRHRELSHDNCGPIGPRTTPSPKLINFGVPFPNGHPTPIGANTQDPFPRIWEPFPGLVPSPSPSPKWTR